MLPYTARITNDDDSPVNGKMAAYEVGTEAITVEENDGGERVPQQATPRGITFKEGSTDSLGGLSDTEEGDKSKTRLGRKRNSEWVFKPLRLKFKVTELEELYKSYVYRQQQSLLFEACLLMVFLSVLVLLVFLGNEKVRVGGGRREGEGMASSVA